MKNLKGLFVAVLALTMCFGCASNNAPAENCEPQVEELAPLPAPQADAESMFGVDANINMTTIDQWVNREDVVYRDVRMLFDPADYGAIGGNADLSSTIEGFKIVPYPYLASLSALPVANAYAGDVLFTLTWNEDGSIASATPNFEESMKIVEELFPKDKPIFIMCGGGGYAGMTKSLLIYLGWDESKLYNVGGNWEYAGTHGIELIDYSEDKDGNNVYATWRADYATIDFSRLHRN